MTLALQIALMSTPLAVYLGALGMLHSGPRPRLVPGPVDAGMLAGGLAGVVVFGPVGQIVVGRIFGGSPLVAWTTWGAAIAVAMALLIVSATRRLAVYNVLPDDLRRAAREAFISLRAGAIPTIDGFEDEARENGITIKASSTLRAGTIEARGRDPESLIATLKPHLRANLVRSGGNPSAMALTLFGLAALTALAGPILRFATWFHHR
jgi:hypothetical protein